jgi:hypothetical protein
MATLVEAYVYITKKAWGVELIWPPPGSNAIGQKFP